VVGFVGKASNGVFHAFTSMIWLYTIVASHTCRLHQILEPFMLRRQVQDVEGKLPEKVTITIKCPMTGYQGAIYDWVKATGLLRIDPTSPDAVRRGIFMRNLKNRIMELRKVGR
jgi:SNF2 family DNA or RNA helicase